jgi:hypothetical protein
VKNTLNWDVKGETFEDGSALLDWIEVYRSKVWHWQYDNHELSFAIYQHDNQYWKLYQVRFTYEEHCYHVYDYGGVACRMALVKYINTARSPHSSKLIQKGEEEWIRTYEYDSSIHKVLLFGERNERYGEPYEENVPFNQKVGSIK